VLLLRHPLAALLYDGAHETILTRRSWHHLACLRTPDAGRQGTRQRLGYRPWCPRSSPRCPRCHELTGSAPVAPLSWLRRMSPAGTG
jgi:hypothetical protein